MYLHLGQDTVVRVQDIIGIFDLENATVSKSTKTFLSRATKEKRVINVTNELPKSFVICVDKYFHQTVYISQISTATLKKRTGYVDHISNV